MIRKLVHNKAFETLSKWLDVDLAYFVQGSIWLASSHALYSAGKLVLAIAFAYLAERALYGQYQLILALLTAMMIFSLPGMDIAILQSVANGFDSSLRVGTRAKARWSILGSIALLGVAAYFYWKQQSFWWLFILAACVFPIFASYHTYGPFYLGKSDYRSAAIRGVQAGLFVTGAVLVALMTSRNLSVLVATFLASTIAINVFFYVQAAKKAKRSVMDKDVVRFGQHLTLMNSIAFVSPHADKIILGALVGFEAVAVYAIAVALMIQLMLAGQLLSYLILPKVSKPNPEHKRKIRRLLWWMLLGAAVLSGFFILITPWIMPLLFSSQYAEAVPYAQLALTYLVFYLPSSVLQAFFQGRKKTKLLYMYNLGTGILNMVFLVTLVPLLGVGGAVLSKVLLGFVGFLFLTIAFYSKSH